MRGQATGAGPSAPTMRAITQEIYGSPEVLSMQTVPVPTIGDQEVLIRVRSTSIHAGDWHLMRGKPFLVSNHSGGGTAHRELRPC